MESLGAIHLLVLYSLEILLTVLGTHMQDSASFLQSNSVLFLGVFLADNMRITWIIDQNVYSISSDFPLKYRNKHYRTSNQIWWMKAFLVLAQLLNNFTFNFVNDLQISTSGLPENYGKYQNFLWLAIFIMVSCKSSRYLEKY